MLLIGPPFRTVLFFFSFSRVFSSPWTRPKPWCGRGNTDNLSRRQGRNENGRITLFVWVSYCPLVRWVRISSFSSLLFRFIRTMEDLVLIQTLLPFSRCLCMLWTVPRICFSNLFLCSSLFSFLYHCFSDFILNFLLGTYTPIIKTISFLPPPLFYSLAIFFSRFLFVCLNIGWLVGRVMIELELNWISLCFLGSLVCSCMFPNQSHQGAANGESPSPRRLHSSTYRDLISFHWRPRLSLSHSLSVVWSNAISKANALANTVPTKT